MEFEFEGLTISAGLDFDHINENIVAMWCMIDEPEVTFRAFKLLNGVGVQVFHTEETNNRSSIHRHRGGNRPQYVVLRNDSSYKLIEWYYNDKRHNSVGPAYIMEGYRGDDEVEYYFNGVDLTKDVLESGYEDNSPELMMLLAMGGSE